MTLPSESRAEPRRLLVLGSHGYLGSRTLAALRELDGLEVLGAGRSTGADVVLDLLDPEQLAKLDDFQGVINCTDSVLVDPAPAIRRCLARGTWFFETSADVSTLERLTLEFRRPSPGACGRLLLGTGIFPGLSNSLARSLAVPDLQFERLDIAIRVSPFAGAGAGMCRLMVEAASNNAVAWEAGRRVELPPPGRPIRFRFQDGAYDGTPARLPEAFMLAQAGDVRNAVAYLVPVPQFVRTGLSILSVALQRRDPPREIYKKLALTFLRALRGFALRGVPTEVTILALAVREDGSRACRWLTVSDGIACAAYAIAAAVRRLLASPSPLVPGAYLPDEALHFDPWLQEIRQLAGTNLRLAVGNDQASNPCGTEAESGDPTGR